MKLTLAENIRSFRKERKKPGATWRPMAKTNRIRPKSFMNSSIVGLILRPKWPRRIPMNNIHDVPRDIPLTLNLLR